MNKGKLYLIPNVIAENTHANVIPPHVFQALQQTHHFLAEDIRTARRYLSQLRIYPSIEDLKFEILNKDTSAMELPTLFAPVFQGLNLGVVSEAGCPGIADPGALAVKYAHESQVEVIPLVGPSSILLALMASGLNGQRFAFHGYLPIEPKECIKVLRDLEKESKTKGQTQVFIETPYRNNHLKELLIKNLNVDTWLSIAQDVTGTQERIRSNSVKKWRTFQEDMAKVPAVFMFLSF